MIGAYGYLVMSCNYLLGFMLIHVSVCIYYMII